MRWLKLRQEKSCGIIPFIIKDNELFVLLIKQNNGVIGFPKGHAEANESDEETALRECFEETNLKPSILRGFREEISYYMPEYDVNKSVVFFIGVIDCLNIKRQVSEIEEIYICKIDEALIMISYDDTKQLLYKATSFMKKLLLK